MSEITLEQIEGIEKRIAYYKELYNGYLEGAWEAEPLEQICKLARQALSQGDVVLDVHAGFIWNKSAREVAVFCLNDEDERKLRQFAASDEYEQVHVTIRRPK